MFDFVNALWHAILIAKGYFTRRNNGETQSRGLVGNRNRGRSNQDLSMEMSDREHCLPTSSAAPPTPNDLLRREYDSEDDLREYPTAVTFSVKFGLEQGILNYLFYISLIQPILKVILCAVVISVDIRLDNNCRAEVICPKPIYTQTRATYFLVAVTTFCVSIAHFCVGAYIFSKYRLLTAENTRRPLYVFASLLCLEILVFIVGAVSAQFSMEFAATYGIIILSEFIAVFAGLFLPARRQPVARAVEINTVVWNVDDDDTLEHEQFV